MPVVVPAVSDGVAPEEVGWKRKLRGSGWMDARGALARKESLGGEGSVSQKIRDAKRKKTHTRLLAHVHRSLMRDRGGSSKWSCREERLS